MANPIPKLQSVESFRELSELAKTPTHEQQPNAAEAHRVTELWIAAVRRTSCLSPFAVI